MLEPLEDLERLPELGVRHRDAQAEREVLRIVPGSVEDLPDARIVVHVEKPQSAPRPERESATPPRRHGRHLHRTGTARAGVETFETIEDGHLEPSLERDGAEAQATGDEWAAGREIRDAP